MSGIEVVALVAGIVNAFTGATELYMNWKENKKNRKEHIENKATEVVLKRCL